MSKFGANPEILISKGNEIVNQSQEFQDNVQKVYQTVQEMVSSGYLSPEAIAIANTIESYRADLNTMTKVINDYGNLCKTAGQKIINNQDSIIKGVRGMMR